MKLKHTFTVFGLVAMLGLGVGVGLASRNAPAREAKAVNNGRFSILIHEDSWWKNDYAQIFVTYSSAGEIRITPDSDLGTVENDGFSWQYIGEDNYAVLTMEVDTTTFTYEHFYFQRKNPSDGSDWGKQDWCLDPSKVEDGTCNTILIDGSNNFSQSWGNYWKITAYSNDLTYADLSHATKNAYLKSAGYGFAPGTPTAPTGYEFVGWYTEKTFENLWTSSNKPTADVTLYAKYEAVSAKFVLENGSEGDTLQYNSQNNQFEGVISGANTKFKVRKYIGASHTDYAALESGMSEHTDVAVVDGDYVKLVADYPVMVYFKNSSYEMWITQASGELIAYAYAGFFLTNVGCDPNGISLPSGWTTVKNRYENPAAVTDAAKDFFFEFDVEAKRATKPNDDIVAMFDRYNLACNRHPSLDKFIKDSGGNARPIPAPASTFTPIAGQISSEINMTLVIAIAASVALVLVIGGYFYLRKRKEDK